LQTSFQRRVWQKQTLKKRGGDEGLIPDDGETKTGPINGNFFSRLEWKVGTTGEGGKWVGGRGVGEKGDRGREGEEGRVGKRNVGVRKGKRQVAEFV